MYIGQKFIDVDDITQHLYKYSYDNNFNFKYIRREKKKIYAKCDINNCIFTVKIHKSLDKTGISIPKESFFYITSGIFEHSCDCLDRVKDYRKVNIKILKKKYQNEILKNQDLKVNLIRNSIQEDIGILPGYHQIHRMKSSILTKYKFSYDECYKYFLSFTNFINSSGGYGLLDLNRDSSFKRVFIGLEYSKRIIRYVRKFLSLDGCIIKNKFKNSLLMAVCLDGDSHIIILAYAIVSIENADNWTWFLLNLRNTLNTDNYEDYSFISDRDKGLKHGLSTVFNESESTICLRHFTSNIRKKCKNKQSMKLFWKAALTFNVTKYDNFMTSIKDDDNLYNFIKDNPNEWARSHIKLPRYSHYCSNISESENNAISKFRSDSDLDLTINIYTYINKLFYKRLEESFKIETLDTPFCNKILKVNMETVQNYSVSNSSCSVAVITHKLLKADNTKNEYIVNLDSKTCSCGHFQDLQIPCFHSNKLLQDRQMSSIDFIADYYKKDAQLMIYSVNSPVFLREFLHSDNVTKKPKVEQKKGRPPTKRKKSYIERCRLYKRKFYGMIDNVTKKQTPNSLPE